MKDSLGRLFQERFRGHEVPVAPGTWQAIQSQITAVPVPQDPAPGQLQEKFAGHEVHVDPTVWQNVSAQLGHGVVAGTTGGGIFGWVAAGVAGLLIVGGLAYTFSTGEAATLAQTPAVPAIQPNTDPVVDPPSTAMFSESAQVERDQTEVIVPAVSTQPKAIIEGAIAPPVNEPTNGEGVGEPAEVLPTTPERSGAEVVDRIIAEMTSKVEQEVRANPTGSPSVDPDKIAPPILEPGIQPEPQAEAPPLPKLFLQNIFTPNGDGTNDVYQVTSEGFTSIMVRVYSVKSNQLVFMSNGNEPWTGANCEDGMYMVAVEATTPDGRLVTEGKVVWLNRNSMN